MRGVTRHGKESGLFHLRIIAHIRQDRQSERCPGQPGNPGKPNHPGQSECTTMCICNRRRVPRSTYRYCETNTAISMPYALCLDVAPAYLIGIATVRALTTRKHNCSFFGDFTNDLGAAAGAIGVLKQSVASQRCRQHCETREA